MLAPTRCSKNADSRITELEETTLELATAVESIVAALLIRDRDPGTAQQLLKDAGALAASIRQAAESAENVERHDA